MFCKQYEKDFCAIVYAYLFWLLFLAHRIQCDTNNYLMYRAYNANKI